MCGAEADGSLELGVYPFGEVSEATIDTADNGACFPLWFLVYLRSAIELWYAQGFCCASSEVGYFLGWECRFVLFDYVFHLFVCPIQETISLFVGELLVGGCIE